MKRLTLMILLMALLALAAEARELTLTQAMQLAEQHSFSLKKSHANSAGSLADFKAARMDRLPTLSATGTGYYVSEVSTMTIDAGPVSVTRDVGTDQTYQADFRLNMPLFTGGRISGGIDIARATADYYAAMESADRDRTDYQARLEYFNLQRADRQLQAAKASLNRVQITLKNVRSLYAAGAADSVNLLETNLALTKATFALNQAETNRRATEIRLAYLLGLSPSEGITISDSVQAPAQVDQQLEVAATKPELRSADAGIRISQSKVSLARADYFPSLSAFTGYSYGKPNLDRFNDRWNGYFTVGANLSWSFNIGNKTGRKTRAAQYYLDAARNDRQTVSENLSRDAEVYYEQLRLAYTRYQSSSEECRISRENYRLAEAQHRDGALASNRLLEIEADLTAAEASLAAALADYYIAQSSYYYATGSENLRKGL